MRRTIDHRRTVIAAVLLAGCTVGPNYRRPAIQTSRQLSRTGATAAERIRHPGRSQMVARFSKTRSCRSWMRTALDAELRPARRGGARGSRRAPISALRDPISFRTWAPARDISTVRLSRNGSDAAARLICAARRIALSAARRSNLLSFEVDIWGRLRRATEAARANLLSAEENRKAVMTTLVSEVASAYFSLRELDYQLEISQRTLATRQDSLALIKNRQTGGVATLLDLRQGEQLVYTASETIPDAAATNRADREPDQLAAGQESGRGAPRTESHRTGDAARGARRFAFRSAGTPAGHPRGGAELDRGQCRDRRSQGGILSANQPHRISGRAGHAAIESVQRTPARLEFHSAGDAADLCRRAAQVEGEAIAKRSATVP